MFEEPRVILQRNYPHGAWTGRNAMTVPMHGLNVELKAFRASSRGATAHVRVTVAVNFGLPLRMSVEEHNVHSIGSGTSIVTTGDPVFDQRCKVYGVPEQAVRDVLSPPIRQLLAHPNAPPPRVNIDGERVELLVSTRDATQHRLPFAVDLAAQLAHQILAVTSRYQQGRSEADVRHHFDSMRRDVDASMAKSARSSWILLAVVLVFLAIVFGGVALLVLGILSGAAAVPP